jgi:hypothetical protein
LTTLGVNGRGRASEFQNRNSLSTPRLATYGLNAPKLIAQVRTTHCGYVEVKSGNKELKTFQSQIPKTLGRGDTPWSALESDVLGFNLISHLQFVGKLQYSVPLQESLPVLLPQLIVSYALFFGWVLLFDTTLIAFMNLLLHLTGY